MLWKAVISWACRLSRNGTPRAYHTDTFKSWLDDEIKDKQRGGK
jgi:hypothetical protein